MTGKDFIFLIIIIALSALCGGLGYKVYFEKKPEGKIIIDTLKFEIEKPVPYPVTKIRIDTQTIPFPVIVPGKNDTIWVSPEPDTFNYVRIYVDSLDRKDIKAEWTSIVHGRLLDHRFNYLEIYPKTIERERMVLRQPVFTIQGLAGFQFSGALHWGGEYI